MIEFCRFQCHKQVIHICLSAEYGIAERYTICGIEITVGSICFIRRYRYTLQHFIHTDFHKAGYQSVIFKSDRVQRNGNDNRLFILIDILYKDLCLRQIFRMKRIRIDIIPGSHGCIYQSFLINKGKPVKVKKGFHPKLKGLQICQIIQIIFRKRIHRYVYDFDVILQVLLYYLFPSAGKFIKIQKTDRLNRLSGTFCSSMPHPQGTKYHDKGDKNTTYDPYPYIYFV